MDIRKRLGELPLVRQLGAADLLGLGRGARSQIEGDPDSKRSLPYPVGEVMAA